MDCLIDLPDFKCNIQGIEDPVLCIKTYLKKVDNHFSGILSKNDVWYSFLYQMVYAQIQIFLQDKILNLHNDIVQENMSFAPMMKNIVKLMDCLALMDVTDGSNCKWTKNCNEVILNIAEYCKDVKIKKEVKNKEENLQDFKIRRNYEEEIMEDTNEDVKIDEVEFEDLKIEHLDAAQKIIEFETENVDPEEVKIEDVDVQDINESDIENLDAESSDEEEIKELKTDDVEAIKIAIKEENEQNSKAAGNNIREFEDEKTKEVKELEIEDLDTTVNYEKQIIELETANMKAEEDREIDYVKIEEVQNLEIVNLDTAGNEEKTIELEDAEVEGVTIEDDEREIMEVEVEDVKTEEAQIKELEIKYLDQEKNLTVKTEDVKIGEVNIEEVKPVMFNIASIFQENVDDFENVEIRRRSFFDTRNMWERLSITTNTKNIDDDIVKN